MNNGVTKYVKLALAAFLSLAFVIVGMDIIRMLLEMGKFDGALMVIGMYVGALASVVKDFLTSGRENVNIDVPAGCKSRYTAEIEC